jgi:hypothetical protein
MKTICLLILMTAAGITAMTQNTELPEERDLLENTDRTLRAANTMCTISFLFQAGGSALIISGYDDMSYEMGFGLSFGIGGVGMASNNAILTDKACQQIKQIKFNAEDSSLRIRMLKNIKAAKTLAIIQNLMPILGFTVGVINYKNTKTNHPDELYTSSAFWIPTISICAIGMALTIPEMILISKTRQGLNAYRRQISVGSTTYGLGIRYKF